MSLIRRRRKNRVRLGAIERPPREPARHVMLVGRCGICARHVEFVQGCGWCTPGTTEPCPHG